MEATSGSEWRLLQGSLDWILEGDTLDREPTAGNGGSIQIQLLLYVPQVHPKLGPKLGHNRCRLASPFGDLEVPMSAVMEEIPLPPPPPPSQPPVSVLRRLARNWRQQCMLKCKQPQFHLQWNRNKHPANPNVLLPSLESTTVLPEWDYLFVPCCFECLLLFEVCPKKKTKKINKKINLFEFVCCLQGPVV